MYYSKPTLQARCSCSSFSILATQSLAALWYVIASWAMLTLTAIVASAADETIIVTTLEDTTDFGGFQQVADLPGPDGRVSFREACNAANNSAGPQTIEFAIPRSEWWLSNELAILKLEDGPFTFTDDGTTLDFTSQTDFTGDTNPSGWEVGMYGLEPNGWGISAIFILADNCVVKGLDHVWQRGFGVQIQGDNNRVISCTISGSLYAGVKVQGFVGDPATGNIIGGTQPGEGNVLSGGNAGIRIDGPTIGTVVIGNSIVGSPYHGVEVRGAYCCPEYTPYDTRIGGPTPEERNWIANNGKYGEEGFPEGDQVHIEWAVDTLVEGNYIGTTEDGSVRFPSANGTAGVAVRESAGTVIRDNLISGIRREGVQPCSWPSLASASWFQDSTQASISRATGSEPMRPVRTRYQTSPESSLAGCRAIRLTYKSGDPIRATATSSRLMPRSGIIVANGVSDAAIYRNSIHSNGLLGIIC